MNSTNNDTQRLNWLSRLFRDNAYEPDWLSVDWYWMKKHEGRTLREAIDSEIALLASEPPVADSKPDSGTKP